MKKEELEKLSRIARVASEAAGCDVHDGGEDASPNVLFADGYEDYYAVLSAVKAAGVYVIEPAPDTGAMLIDVDGTIAELDARDARANASGNADAGNASANADATPAPSASAGTPAASLSDGDPENVSDPTRGITSTEYTPEEIAKMVEEQGHEDALESIRWMEAYREHERETQKDYERWTNSPEFKAAHAQFLAERDARIAAGNPNNDDLLSAQIEPTEASERALHPEKFKRPRGRPRTRPERKKLTPEELRKARSDAGRKGGIAKRGFRGPDRVEFQATSIWKSTLRRLRAAADARGLIISEIIEAALDALARETGGGF